MKQKEGNSKSVRTNQMAKHKSFAQGKQKYKSKAPQWDNKMQWRRKKPQDEARKQKIKEREELRIQKIAEKKAEKERVQREKEERVRIYKKKRLEKTKAVSKKTQRGQPLMKDRMQLLLKQIQEMKRTG
ncbi:thyroid transcription factor 1-associated protein 26 [Anastrepha ludens]|uniref:thyroid transcription factor 1-associated protein 26 n=1 Tax=Anastrepha ludens TaxID=28586 RepID=UPI0023AF7E3A|nr:thyroid transcription factor 1-associated protein 26 [Anastrepha ludens]